VISTDSEKTGMRVELPLLPQLKETLDAGPTGDLAFIVTRRGTVDQGRAGDGVCGGGAAQPGWPGTQPPGGAGPPRPGG
jgi:hypothetical protein